jgi:hypothetical protein
VSITVVRRSEQKRAVTALGITYNYHELWELSNGRIVQVDALTVAEDRSNGTFTVTPVGGAPLPIVVSWDAHGFYVLGSRFAFAGAAVEEAINRSS